MEYTDLVLLDIKHIDDGQHNILTGQSNQNILELAEYLSGYRKAGLDPSSWCQEEVEDAYLARLHDFIATLRM